MQYVRNLEICLPGTFKGNIWRPSFETLKRFIFYSGGTLVQGIEGCKYKKYSTWQSWSGYSLGKHLALRQDMLETSKQANKIGQYKLKLIHTHEDICLNLSPQANLSSCILGYFLAFKSPLKVILRCF